MTGINPAMRKNLLYIVITDLDNDSIDKVQPYTRMTKNDFKGIDLEGYEHLFLSRKKTEKQLCIIND